MPLSYSRLLLRPEQKPTAGFFRVGGDWGLCPQGLKTWHSHVELSVGTKGCKQAQWPEQLMEDRIRWSQLRESAVTKLWSLSWSSCRRTQLSEMTWWLWSGSLLFFSHKLAFTTTHTAVTSRSIMSPSYTTSDSQLHTEHYNQGRVLHSILTQHDKLWTHFLSNEIFFLFFFSEDFRASTSTENYNRNWLLALPYLLSWKLSCCLVLLPNSPEAKWAISQTCQSSRKWRE